MHRIIRFIPKLRVNYKHSQCTFIPKSLINKKTCSFNLSQCYSTETKEPVKVNNFTSNQLLTEDSIKAIVDGDIEIEKLLRVIILEVDILRQDGHLVPDNIEPEEWQELMGLKSRSSRMRYLTFLFKNEKKKENKKLKSEEKLRSRQESKITEDAEDGHIKYGFGGSTIFLRIYDSTMDNYFNKNVMTASMFSQNIVLDCSYEKYMSRFEQRNCAKQIMLVFSENRVHKQPFHVQLCNADPESYTMQCLKKHIPPLYEPHYPFFTTQKSYLDLYPKEKLVYLTPHCRNDLVEWNHDDVYIIGAMVDKTNPKPLSLAKAKEEGLRMAKLPLERFLVWGTGSSKNLTLNQVASILLDVRDTGDWTKGFQHIPKRKIVGNEDLANEMSSNEFKQRTKVKKLHGSSDVLLSSNIINKVKKSTKVDFNTLYD